MKVIDLIIKPQQLPANMDVMIDATRPGATMFHFKEVADVEEIETSLGKKFVVISEGLGMNEEE